MLFSEIDSKSKSDFSHEDLFKQILPFLMHPNAQIRTATINFIKSIGQSGTLTNAEIYYYIKPLVKQYLKCPEKVINFLF